MLNIVMATPNTPTLNHANHLSPALFPEETVTQLKPEVETTIFSVSILSQLIIQYNAMQCNTIQCNVIQNTNVVYVTNNRIFMSVPVFFQYIC